MTPIAQPAPRLSPAGASQLGGLLAGLDRLDPILGLPHHPQIADPPLAFGPYQLRARLGAGAHGVVLLAADPRLDRLVVVKVPQPVVLTDPELRERFVREARAAAALEHPGMVPVIEAGELDELPFLVAGYVPGPSLTGWLDDHPGPVPTRGAAELVAALAAAVHHAHERGVLHCDLTPSNVLLNPPGPGGPRSLASHRPVITDFGLARLTHDDPALTRTFQIAGTLLYMAPEQARGERRHLTARTDVYALGAILYHLLTGRPPFVGPSSEDVVQQVLTAAPACPRELNPAVPRDLRAVCLKCLEKRPSDRYPSAAELAADLDRFLAGLPVAARRLAPATRAARWVRRHPLRAGGALTVVALLAGLGAALTGRWADGVRHAAEVRAGEAERAEAEQRAAAAEFVATFERVRQRREDQEPDWPARNLAELRSLAGSPVAADQLPLLRTEAAAALGGIDLGTPRAVAVGYKAYAPAFSPDGAALALASWLPDGNGTCTVRLLDPATGTERRTLSYPADLEWERRFGAVKKIDSTNLDGCRSLAFSPDGRWLVLGTRSGWLIRWDLSTAAAEPVRWRHAPPAGDPRNVGVRRLAFTATGRALVSADLSRLAVWDTGRTWASVFRTTEPWGTIVRPARFGDPVFVQYGPELRPVGERPPWVGDPVPAKLPGAYPVAGPRAEFLFTEHAETTAHPFVMPPPNSPASGGGQAPFLPPGEARTDYGALENMAVSPDGLYLVTAVEHLGHVKLWCVASGRLLAARTVGEGSLRLAFSPDGRTLAVCTEDRALLFAIPAPSVSRTVALQTFPLADAVLRADAVATVGVTPPGHIVIATGPVPDRAGWVERAGLPDFAPSPVNNNGRRVALPPDGGTAAFTAGTEVWQGRAIDQLVARTAANVSDLCFAPDGRLWIAAGELVGWGRDGSVVPVRASAQVDSHLHPTSLAVGDALLVAGFSDGALLAADPRTGAVARRTPAFDQPLTALSLAPDTRSVVAGSFLGAVRVLNPRPGAVLLDLPSAHRAAVTAAAVGPRGWFATGSRDRTVKVWDPTGRPVLTLPQTRPVRRVFWSADGNTLTILAEGERGLRQWDLAALRAELGAIGLDPALP